MTDPQSLPDLPPTPWDGETFVANARAWRAARLMLPPADVDRLLDMATHLLARAERVEQAAAHAATVFDAYAEMHAAKGTGEALEKSERNRLHALALRVALRRDDTEATHA
jgi:hypothetical protein